MRRDARGRANPSVGRWFRVIVGAHQLRRDQAPNEPDRVIGVKCTLVGPPVGLPGTCEPVPDRLRAREEALDSRDTDGACGRGAIDYE